MKYKKLILIFIATAISTLSTTLFASNDSDIFKRPEHQQLVVDNAGIFNNQQIEALTAKLNTFSRETSTQILIYTTKDLMGYDVADFAQRLGEGWGVGHGKFDNGIVIVFKPKTDEPGRITLQTGYGIEPLIPDVTANRIINHEMIPEFKKGNIYGGINNAVNTCISLTKGEFTAQQYDSKTKDSGSGAGASIIFLVFMITFFSIFGKSRRSKYSTMGSRSNLPFWIALGMLSGGSHRGSGWSDFSSGSGSFGGGGGFGGFGGGSFGGGGASGSW